MAHLDGSDCAPHTAPVPDRPVRKRFCGCSRADSAAGVAKWDCPLHGASDVARAYRAGQRDHAAGYDLDFERPIR